MMINGDGGDGRRMHADERNSKDLNGANGDREIIKTSGGEKMSGSRFGYLGNHGSIFVCACCGHAEISNIRQLAVTDSMIENMGI
jgi:hypothetical protein